MSVSESIAARVAQMAGDGAQASGGEPAAESDSASETKTVAPHDGKASEAESGSAAAATAETVATDATKTDADARKTKHALLEEKLAETRERRQAQRHAERARAERKQAEADRQAAAAERAKYESLKTGTFKETIAALGRDPTEVFNEMQEEARIAGTPEAQLKSMRAMFEKQLAEAIEPLKKTIEQERAEKAELREREENARFGAEFTRAIQDAAYARIREEYSDEQLYKFARNVKHDLTQQGKRFTILDVLKVLKDSQDEHDADKARRNRTQTATQSSAAQAASEKPTVNGTAERRNAGTTLGNDLASSRASGRGSRTHSTRADRIRKLIDEDAG